MPLSEKLAGKVRLELTTCGFGDRCSSQLSYFPAPVTSNIHTLFRFSEKVGAPHHRELHPAASAGFFVHGVFALERTIFFLFQPFGSVALFFRRRIIATFALGALHDYQFTSHFCTLLFKILVYYDISRTVVFAAVRD